MKIAKVSHAQNHLDDLLEEIGLSHLPLQIIGNRVNGVVISQEDWQAI